MKDKIKSKIKELKKELILEEVSKQIENVGYSSLKISDIAKSCEISVGQLYQLFDSKDKLFYEYVFYQINKFFDSLQIACKDIQSPKAKLLIFTKMKIKVFKEKRRVIQDPIAGDPLFFMKINNKNPSIIIHDFLSVQFKELQKEEKIKNKNHLQLAYAYSAYVLGYIEYCFDENLYNDCDEELSKKILDSFLNGILVLQKEI